MRLPTNPDEYLRDVLRQFPTMTSLTAKNYTPAAWKTARDDASG
jgi:hypothetical protein